MRIAGAIAVSTLLALVAPAARADTYDYAIDRFEADGGAHGALDGTPDIVEEFDDGTMGPLFSPVAGTTAETGGALHLKSPGASIGIPGVTPTRFETSAVISSGTTMLQVGAGDMVMRMVLPVQAIGGNDAVNLLVASSSDDGLYYSGVSIANFNATLAERTGQPPGLVILSHQEVISYTTGNQQLILEHDSIEGSPISGSIVLELRWDDTAQTLTSAYSLDGGATFTADFSPLPVESSDGVGNAYLAAVAHEGECPSAFIVQRARLKGLGTPGRSGITMKAAFGGNQRGYEALRFVITDDGAGGATVLDVQLPDTLPSTPVCGPRDGWFSAPGLGRRYRNLSNALPPDCIPGSAQGLQRFDLRWTGTNFLKLKLARGSLPQVIGPLRVALYKGTGPVNECDGQVGVISCKVGPGRAQCGD